MIRRRILLIAAVLLLVAAGAVTALSWWRASAQRAAAVLAAVPVRPDLGNLPAELAQRVQSCEQRIKSGSEAVAALGELSRLYHVNGFFAEASQCYQGLVQADPGNPRWPHLFATILAGYGQLDDALPLWRRAVKLAPDYLPARLRLGDALLKMNRNDEAAEVYAAVLERASRDPYALLGLARIDVTAGRWNAARERLEVVVQQSNYGLGYDLLPTVYEHLGETGRAEAIRARSKASGAYCDVTDPWLDEMVSDCYDTYRISAAAGNADHAGDTRGAILIVQRAIAFAPDKAVFQFQMGGLYLRLNDLASARRYFERCTVLAPDFSDGWAQLADLLMKMGDRETSDRVLAAGLANCPKSPGLHLEFGRRLNAAGRYSEAIAQFQETIRLRPDEAEGFVALAGVYFAVNRIDDGVAELHKALKSEPEYPAALNTLAMYAISVGDEAGAREWMRHLRQQPRARPEDRQSLEQSFQQRFGRPSE